MFIDIYKRLVIVNDFFFKLNIFLLYVFSIFFIIRVIDLCNLDIFWFSRFFRNIRLNFLFYYRVLITKKLKIFLKKRKVFFLRILLNFLGSGVLFYFVFEFFILYVYRIFFNFKLGFYIYLLKRMNLIKFTWYDMYTASIDIMDSIIYKDSFIFKYDIPKFFYNCYLFAENIVLSFLIFTFFGFRFFFYKRLFKYKFYSRIL